MRILLTGSPKTIFGFDRSVRLPNLGLNSIAANLDPGLAEVKVLDLLLTGSNPRHYLKKIIADFQPRVVGLSSMTFQFDEALNLAGFIKSLNPEIKTVLGGYHATVDFESILNSTENSPPFDFLIRNEGELTFNRLIRTLKAQGDLSKIPNLSFISDQTVIHNPPDGVLDLKRLKLPDRDSRIIKKGFHLFGYPADVIETSRGCTFDCDFCSITNMYGKSFRKFEIDRVIRDIRSLDQRGVKAVMLSDDNPTIHGKRFKSLCQAIIDERLNHMRYYVQAGIRGLKQTPGLPETMVQAGAKWIFLGIENVADSNMQFLDKRDQFSKDEAFEVISHLKALGALVFGGFIIGNPDDTEESILQNYEYAKKLGVDVPVFGILTPLPKTPIRQKLIEQGLVTNPHDYSKYTGFDACVRTKHLSAEALQSLRDRLGYRYPFESGAIWRILRTFPLFFPKMVARELMKRPRDVFSYLRGGPR